MQLRRVMGTLAVAGGLFVGLGVPERLVLGVARYGVRGRSIRPRGWAIGTRPPEGGLDARASRLAWGGLSSRPSGAPGSARRARLSVAAPGAPRTYVLGTRPR